MNIDHRIALDALMLNTYSNDVPHLADYFGFWCVYEPVFRAMAEKYSGLNVGLHVQQTMTQPRPALSAGYDRTAEGIAVIQIRGATMKAPSSLDGGTSSVQARMQIRAALRDPAVVGCMLVIDSPGGTVAGNQTLCQDVATFASQKPLYVHVEDMCASAAVAVASQATKRYANIGKAIYGSIGTYGMLIDSSQMADKLGIQVHVIRAGEFKGMGTAGTKVTDSHLAEMQRIINGMNEDYLATIATGLRKPLSAIKSVADGRVIFAADAVGLGLIDGVKEYEAAYAELVQATKRPGTSPAAKQPSSTLPTSQPASIPKSEVTVAEQTGPTVAEQAATFSETVQALCDGGMSRAAAIGKAAKSYPNLHASFVASSQAPQAGKINNAGERAKVIAAWGDQVAATMKARGCDRHKASAIAARENPELHRQMLAATNPRSAAFQ